MTRDPIAMISFAREFCFSLQSAILHSLDNNMILSVAPVSTQDTGVQGLHVDQKLLVLDSGLGHGFSLSSLLSSLGGGRAHT